MAERTGYRLFLPFKHGVPLTTSGLLFRKNKVYVADRLTLYAAADPTWHGHQGDPSTLPQSTVTSGSGVGCDRRLLVMVQ